MSRYILLFLPVFFSTIAQLLVKQSSGKEIRTLSWTISIGWSLAAYLLAFVLYAVSLRYFAISVASPINTISVMLLVVLCGVLFWSEPFGVRQLGGVALGIVSLLLLLPKG